MVVQTLRRLQKLDALALAALIWFIGKFVRYAFPPLFEMLGDSYGVSRTVLGTAFSAFMLVYAVVQLPTGLLADRLGGVRVIVAGSLLTTLGTLAFVVNPPFLVLAGAMAIMGAGTGTYKVAATRLLSRAYPDQLGRVLGVFDTFGTFGGVAAPAAVVVAASLPAAFGAPWQVLYLSVGFASVVLAVAFAFRARARLPSEAGGASEPTPSEKSDAQDDPDRTGASDSGALLTYLLLFRKPRFAGFVTVTILFGFTYHGVVAFLPLYLTTETALSSVTANLLFSVLFVASLVQLVTGEASDRIGTVPVLLLTLVIATVGLVAIIAFSDTGGPLLLGAAVITLGLGGHGFRPVRAAYLMDLVPDSVAGGSFGIVRTLLMGAGAVSPAVVGYISETAGFRTAFLLLTAFVVAAVVLMGLLWILER